MPLTRRSLAKTAALAALAPRPSHAEPAGPGIWRFRFGTPEKITPTSTRRYPPDQAGMAALPSVAACPVTPEAIGATQRGFQLRISLEANELIYGFGLQFQAFQQRGMKRKLRVNADPEVNTGDSHAPVPFYVTTRGYGVLIDTARYAVVYAGNKGRKGDTRRAVGRDVDRNTEPSEVVVEIPSAQGVDVYVFGGPSLREAVQRYNLFSGGGALPPRWGLGFWYRCHLDFTQAEVGRMARDLRSARIPCDVLGLEPAWQTKAYSCSFVWNNQKFPDPSAMIEQLGGDHYQLNLWEHAFTNPASPIHKPLEPHSGDYLVWDGLVPDFLQPEARRIFGAFHDKEHVSRGISGYKLDECDNSDFTRNWSFPELTRFPSGADGEQMHSLFGLRYQDTIQGVFDSHNRPTYGLVRNSGALAAPYPYVLYSDLYNHREFVRGLVNSGFSGLLWCPEVRDAKDPEDLIRRLQTVVFSPLAMVNAWYIRNPPWKQVQQKTNNAGQFEPGWEKVEATCREMIEWRMRLLPYIHAAFVQYHRTGLPPFRALVMDWPADTHTHNVDDQWIMGDSLLVAPIISGDKDRKVYLPPVDWHDLYTGKVLNGGRTVTISPPLERIPVFVKAGTLLPLAEPTLHTADEGGYKLEVRAYGPNPQPTTLYDGDTPVEIAWQSAPRSRYEVLRWVEPGT